MTGASPGKLRASDLMVSLFAGVAVADPSLRFEIRGFHDSKKGVAGDQNFHSLESLVDEVGELATLLADNPGKQNGFGVFYGLQPRVRDSGKNKDVAFAVAMGLDFDGGVELARVRVGRLPWQPSAVVNSGHGLHAILFLKAPWRFKDADEYHRVVKVLAVEYGADTGATDAARVLRLPGTWNLKREPARVVIESLDPDLRYDMGEILACVGEVEALCVPAVPSEPAPAGTNRRLNFAGGTTTAYGKSALAGLEGDLRVATEGTRNTTFTRVAFRAGQLSVAEHVDEQEAHDVLVQTAVDRGLPPGEADDVFRRQFRAGQERPRSSDPKPRQQQSTPVTAGAGSPAPAPVTQVEFTSMAELRKDPPQVPRSLIGDGLLIPGTLVMISGPPKTFKTWATDSLALSLISGMPFLRFPVNRTGPVAVISLEGGIALAYDRIDKIAVGMGVPEDAMHKLLVWDQRKSTWPDLVSSGFLDTLVKALKPVQPIATFIDPIVEAHVQDENSSKEMKFVVSGLRHIAEELGCVLPFNHHTAKAAGHAGRPDPMSARGSTVIYGAVSTGIALEPRRVKGEDLQWRDGVRIGFALRYAPAPNDILAYLDPPTYQFTDAGDAKKKGEGDEDRLRVFLSAHPASSKEGVVAGAGISRAKFDRMRKEEPLKCWLREEKERGTGKLLFSVDSEWQIDEGFNRLHGTGGGCDE